MSYQTRTTYITNLNKKKQRLESKDGVKQRQTFITRINAKDILGNKSENKRKTTTSKFNFQKEKEIPNQNQKKVYLVKALKTIDSFNPLTKKLLIKNSKNSSISKPSNITSSTNRIRTKEDNNNKEKTLFQTIDANKLENKNNA